MKGRLSVWRVTCARVVAVAESTPNTIVVDFMLPSPITETDDNYWDALHYRVAVADRLARDLAAADRGDASDDYRLLLHAGGGR